MLGSTAYTGLYAQAYMALDNDALMDLYRHGGAFGGLAPSQAMLAPSGNPLGISGGLPFFWSPNNEAATFLTAGDDLIASNREPFDFQALLDAGRTSGTAPFLRKGIRSCSTSHCLTEEAISEAART